MIEPYFADSEILACLETAVHLCDQGYQGKILVGAIDGRKILLKSVGGTGIAAWLRRRMLRHEYSIYRRLHGISGIPRCYGLFFDRYLALEYIEATDLRHATVHDRDAFFAALRNSIESIHERGIAHGDLKRKSNILVADDSHPYIIDFGAAVYRKPGFHHFNHFRHRFSWQHDLNAWLKHKYGGNLENMSPEDAKYFRSMWIERAARKLRPAWRILTRRIKKA